MIDLNTIKPDVLYRQEEAAKLIGKKPTWFERHRWAGTGPAYIQGRPVYYKGSDLLAWITSLTVTPGMDK